MPQDSKVAPKDLIQADFRNLRGNERLDTAPKIEELIFMQSMEGRAHNGAGAFRKRFYVNTSIDDIVTALDMDPDTIKGRRQALIDEIKDFVKSVINGECPDRLLNSRGRPLLGIPFFKTRIIDPREVLKGIYMGGLRDSPEIRSEAEKLYNVTIGYGRCYLVNIGVMNEMKYDGEDLAHQEHELDIEAFRKTGLIANPDEIDRIPEKNLRYFYIRHKLGPGQSDDAAMITAGLLYHSVDIALGVFLADAIDTLEKYAPFWADQDYDLALFIKDNFKDLGVTMAEVYHLAYLSAIPEGKEEDVPDSSLRYFLTIDPRTGQSTIECHLNFIEGKPFFPMAISYKRVLITDFYEYIKERLSAVEKIDIPLAVSAIKEGLDVPIGNLINKKVVVTYADTLLSEVLKELKENDAEVIIVQDKKHNIVGIVDASTILHVFERKGRCHS